jgi:hypothetical protein
MCTIDDCPTPRRVNLFRGAPTRKDPMPTAKRSRVLTCLLLVAAAVLLAPQAAMASSSQLSLLQDDRELLGGAGEDPAQAMAEIRDLGVDIVRTNVIYQNVYRTPKDRRRPSGFNPSDPSSSKYNWGPTDRLVDLARANGMQVLMTVTGPGPFFTSSSPSRCKRIPCSYRPKPSDFGAFAAAVAKRYRGKVAYYSVWNEPNIGKTWLTPRYQKTRYGKVDVAGAIYRKLFIAGYKAIAKYDGARRNRVLFGETAAIGAPLPLLYAALCLDSKGKPFTGRLRSLQGCSGHVSRLNVGGFAIHPYNQGGYGTPQSRTKTKSSLPLAYLPRLHSLLSRAAGRGRIGGGKGIWVTEFGYQTRPPDPFGVSPSSQARYINESDRLFFSDSRVKSVAQYELTDVPQRDQFNTGLRFVRSRGGQEKPSYAAYRIPIVVTRRSSGSVEVYGQARPARLSGGRTQVSVQMRIGGVFTTVRVAGTNSRGIFRAIVNRSGAGSARWRLNWQSPTTGQSFFSREATPGKRLVFRKG